MDREDKPIIVHLNTRGCKPMQPETLAALARVFRAVYDQAVTADKPGPFEELYRDIGGEGGGA